MSTERKYVVDRIEGELVVLVDDESGDKANLDSWELPAVDEGTVLAVELDANSKPKWGTASVLTGETKRRMEQGERQIEDMKKRDPGGDVAL
jgi:hypothetical protein